MKKLTFTIAIAVLTMAAIAQTSRRQDNSGNNTHTTNNTNDSRSNFGKEGNATNRNSETHKPNNRENRRGNNTSYNDQNRQRNDNAGTEQKKSGTDYTSYQHNNSYNKRSHNETVTTYYSNDGRRGDNWNYSRRDAHTQKVYTTPRRRIVVDNEHVRYQSTAVHKRHYEHWRAPVHKNIIWTEKMHHEYRVIYPFVDNWCISYGTSILTIAAYEAQYHYGHISKVYGKVSDVFYSTATDEYLLFIGDYYPWQDLTIILPGYIARSYSWNPEIYFRYEYILATGVITAFENKPEMVIKRSYQFSLY